MTIPSFNAEQSLYRSSRHYRSSMPGGNTSGIAPSQRGDLLAADLAEFGHQGQPWKTKPSNGSARRPLMSRWPRRPDRPSRRRTRPGDKPYADRRR